MGKATKELVDRTTELDRKFAQAGLLYTTTYDNRTCVVTVYGDDYQSIYDDEERIASFVESGAGTSGGIVNHFCKALNELE
jgi:hypothetical protein